MVFHSQNEFASVAGGDLAALRNLIIPSTDQTRIANNVYFLKQYTLALKTDQTILKDFLQALLTLIKRNVTGY